MPPPRIEFRGVRKEFRTRNRSDSLRDALPRLAGRLIGRRPPPVQKFVALDDVSFDVEEHEVVGIVGANGAGKSTSLRLAAGVYQPNAGTVKVRGRVSALIELAAGFHPDLSGRENIYLAGALLGLRRRDVQKKYELIAEFADIGDFMESPVRTYSTGMAVRLGFAVAAHVPAEVLLVDEVLAVGDIDFRAKCLRRMSERREEGVSVLFVSHNLIVVEQFCDRVIFVHHGKILADGPPRESLALYRRTIAEERGDRDGGRAVAAQRRPGTHELVLLDVTISGRDESRPGVVQHGGPLRVEADWRVDESVDRPVIAVALYTVDGLLATTTTSATASGAQDRWSGTGRVAVEIEKLSLLPGSYQVSLYAMDSSGLVVLDHHDRLYALEVVGETPPGAAGICDVPARWIVTPGTE